MESAAVVMYKSLHGMMTPKYLGSRFVFRNDITSYRFRDTENKLALPQPRTNYLKNNLSYSGSSKVLEQPIQLHDFKRNLRHQSFK